ncbi:uncharacterized protein LOC144561733 [Carex rostrata]
MEDTNQGKQIPAFGSWNWNLYSDMPITQKYLQSATFFLGAEAEDLFKVVQPTKLNFQNHKKGTNGNVRKEGEKKYKERKPKCMDKDLYEVPPELIYQVRKKKRLLRIFWTGCLSLNCIA